MFVKFISKNIQEKLKSKERALAWKTSSANAPVANGSIRPKDIMSRTTFVRMCSNKDKVDNIVISGGEIGTDGQMEFGLQQLYKASSVGARPIAGIKNIEVIYKGSWKAIREATVNWTVSSIDDLERLTPYFLTVGKTVVLDWGWVNPSTKSFIQQFGRAPFITKKDDGTFKVEQQIFYNPQKIILDAGGDYDAIGGKVSNFEYTLRPDGGFDCITKITAIGSALFQKPLDVGGNTVDTAIDKEGEKSTGFDGIINAIINLRSIIVYQVFGIVPEFHDENSKMYRKKAETYATFKTSVKTIDAPGVGTGDIPIPSFDTKKHSVWISDIEAKGGYSINVDDKNNPNVLWLVFQMDNEEVFVTWAWLEDQLLNRYISFAGGEKKDIKLTLRSIDTVVDKDNKPILTKDLKDKDAVKYGIIKEEVEYKDMASMEVESKTQTQFINESNFNKVVKTPTLIRNEPDFLFPVNAFKFLIPERLPNSSRVDLMIEDLEEQQKKFLDKLRGDRVFRKNQFTNPNNREYGRLRNIWVNIKEIQKAFGIKSTDASTMDKDAVNPPGTLEKGIKNLLNSLNSNFNNFWDFELTVDPYDSTNVKIIDKNVTDLSEQSPDSKTVKYTTFESGNAKSSGERDDREGKESHKIQNLGIYKFPSFKVGSIVKNQNLTFKIPDSMALTILYGSNKPSAKNTSLSSFNNPEIAKLFSTHVTGSDEKDKFSDRYLSSLEPSYYGKAKVENVSLGPSAVLPITVGSEKSNHNSIIGLGIEDGPLVINPYNYWWKRWTGAGVAPANPVDKTQRRKAITKFEIRNNNIVEVSEKSEVKVTKIWGAKGTTRTISVDTTVVGEFELSDKVPPIYEWSNFTELLLKSDVQVLVNNKLNGSLSTEKELKVDTIIPAELTLEIDGIGGILPGDVVQTDYIQPQYNANFYKDAKDYGPLTYFQVVGVSQKVESSGWTTELQTKMRWNHIPAEQDLMVDTVPKEIFEVKKPTTTTIPEILPDPPPRPDVPIPSDEEDIEGDLPLEPLEVEDYEVWVPPQPLSKLKLRRTGPPEFPDKAKFVYQPNNPPPPRPEIPTKHTFDPEILPDVPVTELEFDDIDWTEWKLPEAMNKAQVTFSEELQEEWTEKKKQPVKKEQLTFTKYFGIMYKTLGPTTIFWWDSSWGKGASTGWKTAWKATDNKWSRRLFNKVSVNQIASAFALGAASPTPYNKELGRYPQPDLYFVIGKNYPGVDGQEYMVQDLKSISNYPSPATGTVRLSLMHIEGQYNQIVNITPVVTGD